MVDVVDPFAVGAAGGPEQFAQVASAVPREIVNPFAPDYVPPKDPFKRGLNVGLRGVAAAAGGTGAIAARIAGAKSLEQSALDYTTGQLQEAAPDQMRVEDVNDISSGVDFAKYAAGYLGANFAPSIALGGIGRLLGGVFGKSIGGAAGKLAGQQAGTLAGIAGSSLMQEVGSIFPEAIEQGVEDPVKRSLIGGAIAAAADFIPEAYIANRLGLTGAAKRAVGSRLAVGGKEALKVGTGEAAAELFQTYVERAAAGQPVTGDEANSDYLNSAVLGFGGGGVVGGLTGAYNATRATVDDVQPGAASTDRGQPPPVDTTPPVTPSVAPPEPSAFRQFDAGEARLDVRADQMRAADTTPAPVSEAEAESIALRDRQQAATQRLNALDAEELLPQKERRTKQVIAAERKALTAELAKSAERLRTLAVLEATPEYQQKTRTVEPVLIGQQKAQAEAKTGPLLPIDPADVPGFARTAEQRVELAARARATPPLEVVQTRVTKQDQAKQPATVARSGPPGEQLKLFSKTAVTSPTGRIVFSHWGNVPAGRTDPTKLGTGVKGADWEPAKRAGLTYTSAVVRGSDYKEAAVVGSGRKQYVGSLPADKVYEARADDPLLKQAFAETANEYGATDPQAAWMEYAKKVRDQGYEAMLYGGGQLRIFTPQQVAPEPTPESIKSHVAPTLARHMANGGSTTSLVTGQDLGGTQTYSVSPYKDREQVIPGQPTKEQLAAYVEKNKDLLSTPDHALGTWFNPDDGNTYLDVAITVSDKETALRIARENKQLAIFDLRTYTTIPTAEKQTDTEAFRKWFGDSKVVDKDGKPLVVYHGTAADFSSFRPTIYGDRYHFGTREQANARIGASDEVVRIANTYGGPEEHQVDRHVMPVYLSIRNPLRLPDLDQWVNKAPWLAKENRAQMPPKVSDMVWRASQDTNRFTFLNKVIDGLEALGYDGIVYKNNHENWRKPADSWMAFRPEQIKSAVGNRGTFDAASPNILHSRAASERYESISTRKGEEAISRLEQILGSREGLEVRTYTGDGAAGSISLGALKDVIELNLNAKDVLSTAYHEGYHYLEYRVLSPSERKIVEKAFRPGGDYHNKLLERARAYDARNGTHIADEIRAVPAEARAYGFEFWTRGELKADGVVARAWAAIKRMIERISNMIEGLGFQSKEDIFEAIRNGYYARMAKEGRGAPFRTLDLDSAYLSDIEPDAIEGTAIFKRDPSASSARGRPFWVNSAGDVRNMRMRIRLLALEGEAARDWHARSGSAVMEWAKGDRQRAAKLAALIANYSPRTPVGRDLVKAITHLNQWESGRAISVGAPAAHIKGGNDILSNVNLDENGYVQPTGIKRQNFFRNLMLGIDPVRYNAETQGSTIDMWMSHAFNYGEVNGAVTKSQYNYADAEVKRLAKELGWQVEETQAAIWVAIKARGDSVRSLIEKTAERNGWYDYRLKKERPGMTSDMFGQQEGKYERFVKPEFNRAFVTQWMNFALTMPFSAEAFARANYSYLEAFQDLANGRLRAEGSENLPFAIDDDAVQDTDPRDYTMSLFSRAALSELAQRARNGEIEQVQVNARVAELLDSQEAREGGLRDRLVARGLDELTGARGSIKRGYLANFSSGENLARQSEGYRNVFGALTAFTQRKNRLIADAVEKQLSKWVKGATEADKEAASAALLERTVQGYEAGSTQYNALIARLTPGQQEMFKQATDMIANRLDAEFRADAESFARALGPETAQYRDWFEARRAQVEELKLRGYFPERRYGDHIVHAYVEGENGKKITVYYTQHEREADARVEEREVGQAFAGEPGVKVEYGYRYKADYDGSLSFQQFLDMANRHGVAITQAERERLARAMVSADSVRRNRIFRRKNIAGYSEDGMRILAEFGVAMANKIAYHEVGAAVSDAIAGRKVDATFDRSGNLKIETYQDTDLWKDDGALGNFYRNLADQTADFVLSPQDGSKWSRGLRAAASVQFLGGSIAAGMVQLTSIPMNTIPWLTQQTGYTDAFARTMDAFRLTLTHRDVLTDIPKVLDDTIRIEGVDDVEGLRHALQVAAQDGTTLDTEIYQLMGLSRGQEFSFSGRVQQAVKLWMAPFRVTEQINRVTTFIAAYKLAKDKGMANDEAYKSAQETVYATQFRYDEANRPALARGDLGALLFTFKTYPIFMAETLAHLARVNPSSAVFMLTSLTVMAGIEGLPFAEDLEDLIDTIAQRVFGSPFNTKRALRNVLKNASEAIVGADLSGILMHGIANEMTGLNFASRVGLGNFIPGTRIGAADADYKRVMSEILGPVGTQVQGYITGTGSLLKGDFLTAAKQALPLAAQNAIKGWEQWGRGYATDIGGRKLIDVDGWQAFWQSLGFSSAALGRAYEADRIDKQTRAFYDAAHQDFVKDLIKAVSDNDQEGARRVMEAVIAWNKAHPDMPMALSPASTRRTIQQAGMSLNQRTFMTLPKGLRGSSEYALGVDDDR